MLQTTRRPFTDPEIYYEKKLELTNQLYLDSMSRVLAKLHATQKENRELKAKLKELNKK